MRGNKTGVSLWEHRQDFHHPSTQRKDMKSPIRVALLLPSLPVGGAEILILEEMKLLATHDNIIFEIILPFEPGALYEKVRATGVAISVFHATHTLFSNLKTYGRILIFLRRKKFDILHVHLMYHGVLLGKLAGTPRVFATIHSYQKFSFFELFCLRFSDKIFGCGEMVADMMKRLFPKKSVICVKNGLDPEIPDKEKNLVPKRKGEVFISSLGRLDAKKGFEYLIEAIRHVAKESPDVKLHIAGEGKQKHLLRQQIANARLQKNVILLGHVDGVTSLLMSSDIYASPSLLEGLPMSLLEAMRCSLPIIATDIEGNRGVIKHEETGLLVRTREPEALADAIRRLVRDPKFGKELGKKAHQVFKNQFTIQQHCHQLLNEYGVQGCPNEILEHLKKC